MQIAISDEKSVATAQPADFGVVAARVRPASDGWHVFAEHPAMETDEGDVFEVPIRVVALSACLRLEQALGRRRGREPEFLHESGGDARSGAVTAENNDGRHTITGEV